MLSALADTPYGLAGFVAGCAAAGWLAGLVAGSALKSLASRRALAALGAVAESLHGLPIVWGALAGAGVVLPMLDLAPRYDRLAATTLLVLAVVSVTVFATRLAGRLVRAWTSREGTTVPSGSIFVNLARLTTILVGTLVALAALGVSITPLLTAAGVGGLAVALALQDTLGNLFAGLQVVLSRQIEPGDYIRLETGQEGWVHDVTWRNTTVRQLSNDLVIVPNAVIGKSLVTNFTSLDEQHSVTVPFQVGFDADLDRVEEIVRTVAADVMREIEGGVPDSKPSVRFRGFAEPGIDAVAVLRVATYADRPAVLSEFVKRLHSTFIAEGIEFPSPRRAIRVVSDEPAVSPPT